MFVPTPALDQAAWIFQWVDDMPLIAGMETRWYTRGVDGCGFDTIFDWLASAVVCCLESEVWGRGLLAIYS
jgi:hypothetical protein